MTAPSFQGSPTGGPLSSVTMPHVTESVTVCEETGKTDETVNVTNNEFMDAVFGTEYSDIRSMVVSFEGNPHTVSKSAWAGAAWSQDSILPLDNNNFFSLSSFRPNDAGQYRRQKSQFSALHVIVLDDVGTKVGKERVKLQPSWVLETSEGNFQYGYILSEPLRDAATADKLVNATIAASLCDPGASGPTARIVRLPEGVNGKHDPAFRCRMMSWNPDRRYAIEQLVDGLELDMNPLGNRKRGEKHTGAPDGGDLVFVPCPTENAVIVALKDRKLYKAPLGDGKHDITCPWCTEHTGAVDGGTAYFEPSDEFPIGGFHCFHGHCKDRHIRDFLQNLGVEVAAARMKPTIRVVQGEIHRVVDAAEKELAKSGKYYQRGGSIAAIHTDPGTRETTVKPLGKPALTAALSSVSVWEKYDGRSHAMTRIDPPERHCMVLADAVEYKHLPVLNGLARQPYLRPDGTIVKTAGYDAATGMYGVFNAMDFSIPDEPTKEDAEKALHLIKGLLGEFSFKYESDCSAALSAIFTAVIRPSLPLAPAFHVKAPVIGSGKTFLCQVITAHASPQRSAPMTFPQDDEECRKLLHAEFLKSPAVIEFDNLTGDLVPHKSLCTALTSEFVTGRILGVSKTATVGTRALFLSSGNNVGPVGDMARRCVTINLDPACETPAARIFRNPDLLSNLLRDRGQYVSAALTIIRAWIVAGRPKAECKSIASYGDWSDLCRQPLLWLGLPDPVSSIFETMMEDPERETLGRFLEVWHGCFGSKPMMIRDAMNFIPSAATGSIQELREVMQDIAAERDGIINRKRLGWWMKRHAGRIVDSKRLVSVGGSGSAGKWKVESVS